MSVKQRARLRQLQTLTTRAILVSHSIRQDTWHRFDHDPNKKAIGLPPHDSCHSRGCAAYDIELRSILPNELFFDLDTTWERIINFDQRWENYANAKRIPFERSTTSGKGAHYSVFLDSNVTVSKAARKVFVEAGRRSIDIAATMRESLIEGILTDMDIPMPWWKGNPREGNPAFGPNGFLDPLKVRFAADRMGSMVRMMGTKRKGLVKTWHQEPFDLDRNRARLAPLRYPPKPKVWDFTDWEGVIVGALERETATRNTQSVGTRKSATSEAAVNRVRRAACTSELLANGRPRGTLHRSVVSLAIATRECGGTPDDAAVLVEEFLTASGEDFSQSVEMPKIASVFEQDRGYYLSCATMRDELGCPCRRMTCPIKSGKTFVKNTVNVETEGQAMISNE